MPGLGLGGGLAFWRRGGGASAPFDGTVNARRASLVLTPYDPTVTAGLVVTSELVSLSLAPQVPVVGLALNVTPDAVGLVVSPQEPSVTLDEAAQITSVAMSAQNTTTGDVPVEITATDDDTFSWILTSIDPSSSPPSVAQVAAGNGQDGNAAEDSGEVTTTGGTGVLDNLTTGLNESLYLVVADNNSVHFDATAEAIDTRVPSLTSPTATAASATSINAGVTSSLAGGEIFFAARLASDPVLSISDIENGTGDAVATGSDATPTADGNNAATLTGLSQGTAYDIDSFQRRLGQESAVATSAAATTWDVPDAFVDANWSVATGSGESELDITIASLPANNGAAITDIEYDVGASGTWISLGGTTGPFTITMAAASTSYAIRLRAVNSVGNSAAGNSESATSGAAAPAGIVVAGSMSDTVSLTGDTITLPGTPAENDVVLILRAKDVDGSAIPSISGYTNIREASVGVSRFSADWKRLGSTPDTDVTISGLGGADVGNVQVAHIYLLRGVNLTTVLDVSLPAATSSNNTTNSVTPPAITTATNGALVIIAATADDLNTSESITVTPPSGYSETILSDAGGGVLANVWLYTAVKLVPTAGTETPGTITFSGPLTTEDNGAHTIAIRPA